MGRVGGARASNRLGSDAALTPVGCVTLVTSWSKVDDLSQAWGGLTCLHDPVLMGEVNEVSVRVPGTREVYRMRPPSSYTLLPSRDIS